MAKIVPQGYSDIQQSNQMNDYLTLIQYLDSLAGTYKDIQQNQVASVNSGLTDILEYIESGHIGSNADMTQIKNQYNSLKSEAYGTNNTTTEHAYERVGTILNNEETDFNRYKEGVDEFMQWYDIDRFAQMYNEDGTLDITKLQEWDEGQIAGFNEITNKYNTMKTKLGWDPANQQFINTKYGNYSVIDLAGNTVKGSDIQAKMLEMDNFITKMGHGLLNVISAEELSLIANNTISAEKFTGIASQGIDESLARINKSQGNRDKYNMLLNTLEENKLQSIESTLRYVASTQDPNGDMMTWINDYSNENFGAQGWIDFTQVTPGDLEERANNLIAKKNKNIVLSPGEATIVSKWEQYEEFIEDIEKNVLYESELIDKSIVRYNAFSPIAYDVNMSGANIQPTTVPITEPTVVTASDIDSETALNIFYSLPENSRNEWTKIATGWDGNSVLFGGGILSPTFTEQSNETISFNG